MKLNFSDLDKLITELLDEQQASAKGAVLLSAYLQLNGRSKVVLSKEKVAKKIALKLVDALKKDERWTSYHHLQQKVKQAITKAVREQEQIAHYGAVFLRIDDPQALEKHRDAQISADQMWLVFTENQLQPTVQIGQVFDLTQLLWLKNLAYSALVLVLSQKDVLVFQLVDDQIEEVEQVTNDYWDLLTGGEDEYLEIHRPTGREGAHYSTGESNVDRKKLQADQLFLNEVEEYLVEKKVQQNSTEYLIIFYSEAYEEIVEKFADKSSIKSKYQPILIGKNVSNQSEKIKSLAKQAILDSKLEVQHQEFQKAAELKDKYVVGWPAVIKSARENKIQQLYLQPKASSTGYLASDGQIYSSSKNGAKKVANIRPRVVAQVLNASGEVLVLDEDRMKDEPVAARLRY